MNDEVEEQNKESLYITVCDCGKIVYNGKKIGMLDLDPEFLMYEGEIVLTFVKDSCGEGE